MSEYLTQLRPYCRTERQKEVLEAVIAHEGNLSQTSHSLGINRSGARKIIKTIRNNAAIQGYAPEYDLTHPLPDTQMLKGVSTYYDQNGVIKGQWVKSNAKAVDVLEALNAIASELKEAIVPIETFYTPPTGNEDLLNLHVLTDFHLGMFAWEEDADTNWSTEKAEQFLLTWFKYAIDNAPSAKYGLLLNLGDFFHSDNVNPVTPTSGHLLDVDTKYAKLVRIGIRVIKQIVEMMRAKYEVVLIYHVAGNHDFTSTIWLKEFFATYYKSDKNVIVDSSPDIYHAYQHGDTSLFFHHGHKRNIKNISETLVAKFRSIFGATAQSYTHIGHFHHTEIKEYPSMLIEQHRTMTPKDTYSAHGGYFSGRSALVITYHKTHGEVNRVNITANLIESMIKA